MKGYTILTIKTMCDGVCYAVLQTVILSDDESYGDDEGISVLICLLASAFCISVLRPSVPTDLM